MSGFDGPQQVQQSLFADEEREKLSQLDQVADQIREKFGSSALHRASGLHYDAEHTPMPRRKRAGSGAVRMRTLDQSACHAAGASELRRTGNKCEPVCVMRHALPAEIPEKSAFADFSGISFGSRLNTETNRLSKVGTLVRWR